MIGQQCDCHFSWSTDRHVDAGSVDASVVGPLVRLSWQEADQDAASSLVRHERLAHVFFVVPSFEVRAPATRATHGCRAVELLEELRHVHALPTGVRADKDSWDAVVVDGCVAGHNGRRVRHVVLDDSGHPHELQESVEAGEKEANDAACLHVSSDHRVSLEASSLDAGCRQRLCSQLSAAVLDRSPDASRFTS